LALTGEIVPERIAAYLLRLSRLRKQALMIVADVVILVFAGWAAYALRLGEWFLPNSQQVLLLLAAPILALPVFLRSGLYRSVIRYLGEHALWTTVRAMSIAAVLWAALAFLAAWTGREGMPRSVPLIYWMLGTIGVGGIRFAARRLLRGQAQGPHPGRPVLIYGAGEAGRQLAASLRQGGDLFPAGFVDDDKLLHGADVAGLRVYPAHELSRLIGHFDIHDVIVTMPEASSARRREAVLRLEQHAVRVRILPALADIANGRHLVNMVREVDIGDLLGRDPVASNPALLGRCISGKNVLVTGAGGSIGSELCRQITALGPSRLVLLDASEHALYQIERVIRTIADFSVVPCLGSVIDGGLVNRILIENGIQTIYHAAAHKHVPLVEANVLEGVRNNVLGTLTVAQAAFDARVETFVLISTDKAVRPTNVMGATKRWAELVVQDIAHRAAEQSTGQRFCAVRFGNVLGSSGSVIPLFKEQIAQGGPVTVTHADVTRFFMSIHEAVELVIQAGSMANGGEIFLLDMGGPVKIMDLARNMVRLAGHSVRDESNASGDMEIIITGLRPGEKLYEELLIESSNGEGTTHPKIVKAREPRLDHKVLHELIARLRQTISENNASVARQVLMDVALKTISETVRKEAS
jgi:FlaA1/EpsC-like NDP-sugar epimerase